MTAQSMHSVSAGSPRDLTLRELASAGGLHIAAAVQQESLRDPKGSAVLPKHFNLLVPENDMKWNRIQPARGQWNFGFADEIVNFAQRHGITVKGTALLRYKSTPDYVGEVTANQMSGAIDAHIAGSTPQLSTHSKVRETSDVMVQESTMIRVASRSLTRVGGLVVSEFESHHT